MTRNVVLFIQNYATDPPHLVADWLDEVGFSVRTIRAFDGEAVPSYLSEEIAALIPLGGAMNAMQDAEYPWLVDEKKLIKQTVESGTPVLGICLGAQLLGAALGGTVSRLTSNEIGIYEINQVVEDPIMNVGSSSPATQWHEDYVSILPAGATLVANSKLCPTQIFKVGELTYGLQCHPEADASIVALWEAKPDNAFANFDGAPVGATVASTVQAREGDLEKTWKPIIQNWGRAVLNRSSVK